MDSQVNTHSYASLMLEQALVGIGLYDARNLRLLDANEVYLMIIETYLKPSGPHGDVIGHCFTNWLSETEAASNEVIFRAVVETGIPYRAGTYAFHTQEGDSTYWTWNLNPVRDQEGQITHLLQTVSEVTEQILIRQQVQVSLNQTNHLVEAERHQLEIITAVAGSVHEPLNVRHIGNTAIDAIYDHFNPVGACLHLADSVQQALHLLCFRTPPGSGQALHLLQYVPYKSSMFLAKACQHHEPILIEDLQVAATMGMITKDHPLVTGGVRGCICVPLWFGDQFEGALTATFSEGIHSHDIEVRALEGCGTHIAAALAHARLHTAVENERTRLRIILDQLPEGILITESSNGLISYANTAAVRLLGVPLMNLVGTSLDSDLQDHTGTDLNGQHIPPWNFAVIHALSEETVKSQETVVNRPDGSSVVTLCSCAPLSSGNGTLTGAVLVFQDVTAQKSLEQHKNEFLSMANHELRTPVTAIQGLAELLQIQGQSLDSLRSQRALKRIIEQSQHLTHLIEEMLDLSRIEQAQFTLKRTPHDLLGTLTRVVESQSTTTRHHHLRLVLEGLETTDTFIGSFDEERIIQAVSNLISNAIKYSPVGGEIEVGLRPIGEPYAQQRPHEALIWVKDYGLGIPTEEIPRIFKRFHRVDTLDPSIGGLGIGLYLVKEIITRHGGRVWVESTERSGSTFYVLLPLDSDDV